MEKEDSDCVVQKVCCGVRAGVLKSNRKLVWVQRSPPPPRLFAEQKQGQFRRLCCKKRMGEEEAKKPVTGQTLQTKRPLLAFEKHGCWLVLISSSILL